MKKEQAALRKLAIKGGTSRSIIADTWMVPLIIKQGATRIVMESLARQFSVPTRRFEIR